MLRFIRIILFTTIAFFLLLIAPKKTFAAGEFQINYKVLYSVQVDGQTQVTQNVDLVNKTPNYYADKFELKIGSTKVDNVKAHDETGNLQTDVKFENNLTTISVKFNQKVIGLDKRESWTLTYTSAELASKSGQIWEISIPRLAKSADIGTYDATLSVPQTFGPVAFTTPDPKTQNKSGLAQNYTFDRDQLTNSGISMSFGSKQVFSFDIKYHLENPSLTTQIEEITLPPDNNYQKLVLEKIDPPPMDVVVNPEGNFVAKYKLATKQSVEVKTSGYIEVFSKPFRNINKKLTDAEKKSYLLPQRYWEVDNGQIHDKAQELKTPEAIYKFVSDYLTYSQERLKSGKLERLGALSALASPKDAVCTEFTDLFIALSRAAGIPAREVEGFAYTQNERLRPLSLALTEGDILHAWPEYWDDNLGWVQVDPTWGSTSGGLDYFNKLDFNHITFVERGINSTEPFPAGSFKKESERSQKYINIAFATDLPNPTSTPVVSLAVGSRIYAGLANKAKAEIKNTGSTSILNQKVTFATQGIEVSENKDYVVDLLPPFATKSFDFTLQNENLLTRGNGRITFSFADAQISKPVEILPIYFALFTPTFAVSIAAIVVIFGGGLMLYSRTHRKKSPQVH